MRDLSLNIMDIAQNSVYACAKLVEIYVSEKTETNALCICITDNGRGMSKELLTKSTDPFFTTRTTRKVGLGLSLLKMKAEMAGGKLSVSSNENKGTCVRADFDTSSIDMPAVGDIENTVFLLISSNPMIDFVYTRELDDKTFTFDTREIKEVLGENVRIDDIEVLAWVRENLSELKRSLMK